MAIRINNLQRSSTGATPQGVSIGDAVKPALALGSIAGAIGKAGDKIHAHDMKIMEAENSADLTEFKTAAKTAYANRMQSFAEDHDHLKYRDNWEKDLEGLKKGLADKGYSPDTLARAKEYLSGFEGDTRIAVASAAQKKAVERGRMQFKNGVQQIEQFYDPSNPEVAYSMLQDTLNDQTHMTPEEKEAAFNQFDQFAMRKNVFHQATTDPRGWLERHPTPGKDHALWDQGRRVAKARLRELVGEQADTVMNGIAMGSVDEKDIESLTPDMDAVGRKKLLGYLRDSQDEAKREFMRSPSEQARLAGSIAMMIEDYKPNGEKFDSDFVAIKSQLQWMAKGALRDEYEDQLEGLRNDKEREVKTVKDWGFKQISEVAEAGLLGKVEKVNFTL